MVNIAIIGNSKCGKTDLASIFGKKGTDSDITFFNTRKQNKEYIFIDPKTYPKTLKSLITAITLSDIIIFCISIDNIDLYTGECILALDILKKKNGVIVITKTDMTYNENIQNFSKKIKSIIKGTIIENWNILPINTNKNCKNSFFGIDNLQNEIQKLSSIIEKEIHNYSLKKKRVIIDHYFNVTGIGLVILGKVYQGIVKTHDKLMLYPINKKVEIRSIQRNDINIKEAIPGDRVGIGIKGISEKEIERGFILSEEEFTSNKIKILFTLSKYSKEINEKDSVYFFLGLQSGIITIEKIENKNNKENNIILICNLNKKISYSYDDNIILVNLNIEKKQRFIGIGKIIPI